MAVAANIAVAWPSTAASIPAGWTRETSLDGVYVVGAATGADADLVTPRGSASHTHTSPAHAPLQDPHNHTFFSFSLIGTTRILAGGSPIYTAPNIGHGHTGVSSNATAVNDSVSITVDATANELAYASVIWIKSDGSPTALPAGCVAFWMDDALPSGWTRTLAGKYLKGAAAAGDGGGTGGANTHTHTSPAHTHNIQDHQHAPIASSGPDFTANVRATTAANNVSDTTHTHDVTMDFGSGAVNQAVTTTIDPANHEPPFTFVNAIMPAVPDLPVGVVALWLGTVAALPGEWTRVTSLDGRWIKLAAVGEVTTTGGAATHIHTASACQPLQDPHSHDAFGGTGTGGSHLVNTGTGFSASNAHTHEWGSDITTATNQAASVTVDASAAGDAYPLYRTVIFVQLSGVHVTGTTTYTYGGTGGPRANREDLQEQDLRRAMYRKRRRGEG